ncbi:hypothetical protein [Fodinibius sp. Rm-B-1B1-1]|uniref:hypothetical protein n=1 Tax=Fodinibius alkaliphilus TaxID=3140241 RepID=UPI00315A85CE
MVWVTLLMVLAGAFVAAKFFSLTNKKGRLKYLGLTVASVLFTIMHLALFIDNLSSGSEVTTAAEFIFEWGHITSLAFILSSLAIFIRESKPVFAQFPMVYTALPLLIIISYLLVQDTYALKTWLLAIYQGGAILVGLLMYSVYTYRRSEYRLILGGVILFLISYILFWHVPLISESYAWTWKIMIIIAMVVSIYGYEDTEQQIPATETV